MHNLHNDEDDLLETNVEAAAPVLIVDDNSLLAGSLAMVLTAEGCAVRALKATTVHQLEAEIAGRAPAVTLVRIQPGPSLARSLELVKTAAKDGATVAVLSDSTHELLLSAAVHAGATGLVASSDLMIDTVDQILAMVKGEQLISELRREELVDLFLTHRVDRDNRFMPFESLSRRESEVLCLLMEGHSVAKIAESSFVSVGTVRTQVKAILRKLGVSSQAAAVALAYRSGWPVADPALPVDMRLRNLS
ncbi:MAG: two-component system nitrate/nitrite response regulator NarL [Thermoproteota archaeon]|jgi:DNA-binding NarL/FixJ family response regulator